MAEYYEGAGRRIDEQKKALLAGIAQQGSAAQQAYADAQSAMAAQRSQAARSALDEAARRGAPAALQSQLAATASQPYDRRLADVQSASATRAASFAADQGAADAYMTEAGAAIPAMRSRLDEIVAVEEARTRRRVAEMAEERRREQERLEFERERMAFQREQMEFERRKMTGEGMSPDDILDKLGGRDPALDYLVQQGMVLESGQAAAYDQQRRELRSLGAGGNRIARGEAELTVNPGFRPGEAAEQVGRHIGLPANYTTSMLASREREQSAKVPDDRQVRSTPVYQEAASRFLRAYELVGEDGGPGSVGEIIEQLVRDYGPDIARMVFSDFKSVSQEYS